jgi:hypothetical protein
MVAGMEECCVMEISQTQADGLVYHNAHSQYGGHTGDNLYIRYQQAQRTGSISFPAAPLYRENVNTASV